MLRADVPTQRAYLLVASPDAPGGIADYCARYTGFYKRLQAKPAGVEVFEDANIDRLLKEWGKQASPEQLAALTRWRDQRLAALAAHKKEQKPSA